jgi:hypothetical protein
VTNGAPGSYGGGAGSGIVPKAGAPGIIVIEYEPTSEVKFQARLIGA